MKSDTRVLDSAPKLCRDCKWMRDWRTNGEFAKCDAPGSMRIDPVTGDGVRRYTYCSSHRKGASLDEHDCGSEGRFWEPVE